MKNKKGIIIQNNLQNLKKNLKKIQKMAQTTKMIN